MSSTGDLAFHMVNAKNLRDADETAAAWMQRSRELEQQIRNLEIKRRVQVEERDELIETLKNSIKVHKEALDKAATELGQQDKTITNLKRDNADKSAEIAANDRRISTYFGHLNRLSIVKSVDLFISSNEAAVRTLLTEMASK